MPIREARIEDAAQMAQVRVDTWRAAYRGIVPDATLARLSYGETERFLRRVLWEDNHGTFAYVAENDAAEVVGLSVAGAVIGQADPVYRGELYILYILPEWQRHGFGRGLLAAAARGLVQRGLTPMLLWVLAQNPARQFYERLGGVVLREREEEMDGKSLVEVAYGWQDPSGLFA
jgi:ribosomal protein S18 acetylase RimI-like enzyme